MKPQFPTVQEQVNYWNEIERLEHERVMDIRAESPNERNETREVKRLTDAVNKAQDRLYFAVNDPLTLDSLKTVCRSLRVDLQQALAQNLIASNPQEQAATTALTLDQIEATADWFDGLADTPYHLRDEGSVDGEGESYAARNL